MSLTPIRIIILLFVALTPATPLLYAKQEKKLPTTNPWPETKSCVDINVLKTCKKGKCTNAKCSEGQYCLEPKQVYGTDAKASPIQVAACYAGTASELSCVGDHHLLVGLALVGKNSSVEIKKPCPEDKPYCVNKVEKKNLCQEKPLACVDEDKTDYEKIIKQWSASQQKTGTIGDASVLNGSKITDGVKDDPTTPIKETPKTLAKDVCKNKGGPYLQEQACDKNGKAQTLTIDCRSLAPPNTPPAKQPYCETLANNLARCSGIYPDSDGDWVKDPFDNCPKVSNLLQEDGDGDGFGDVCDNCKSKPNPSQGDMDNDKLGDDCDNCPSVSNTDQANLDKDVTGDACDHCSYDHILVSEEINSKDADNDGIFDSCEFPQRVSVNSDGNAGKYGGTAYTLTNGPDLSGNGRFIVFTSLAPNLVDEDNNGCTDVFVHDRYKHETTRVSVNSAGSEGNLNSREAPTISVDGRVVAFTSYASNLVDGDDNGRVDIFVHDRDLHETTRVSITSVGTDADDDSNHASISANGRLVTFSSRAANLVNDDSLGYSSVFIHDRKTKLTTLVDGYADYMSASTPSLSANGKFVTFTAGPFTQGFENTNDDYDIYVHELNTKKTALISLSPLGAPSNDGSLGSNLSTNGRFIAFWSAASNLVNGDTNGKDDVFVHDQNSNQTTRVSVASSGFEADGDSFGNSISADGRFVAFYSVATNLVDNDKNGLMDVFVHDRSTNKTTRLSVSNTGGEGNADSVLPRLSDDGRFVAFDSWASKLVDNDENGAVDVFVTINPLWTPPEDF